MNTYSYFCLFLISDIMNNRDFKDNAYNEISRIAKALSNPNRLEIIDFIANGEKCVEDIALQTGISIANASQHLQTLKRERLVKARKDGVQVYYSLASKEVYRAWKGLRDLALQLSPHIRQVIDQIRMSSEYDLPVTQDQLKTRKDLHFLDVRPKDEYQKGHLPEAISIPLDELEERLGDLPKDKLIIAYCRGMFCTLADEAVKTLRAKGYKARKIELSVPEYELSMER